MALGQGDGDVAGRAPVQLGGAAGAGPGPAGAPGEDRLQQSLLGEPFEMEGRGGARQVQSLGDVVAAHGLRPPCDVVVHLAARRLAERGDGGDPGGPELLVFVHGTTL
nr:hypothetical protein GCM10020093_100410 [Planobispora longispora]